MTAADGHHDPTQHTQAEKDWARNKMQEWADARTPDELFNDRRTT